MQGALLTYKQASERYGVPVRTLRRWTNLPVHALPCIRKSHKWVRLVAGEVERWLQKDLR